MPNRKTASEIEDAATVWAVKAECGLTEAEHADFESWIGEDSRHLGAYVRAQAAWIHAERAVALGKMPEPADQPVAEISPIYEPQPRTFNRRMIIGAGSAIAASVGVAYVVGFDRNRTLESGVGEIRHIALQGGTTLTLDTDTRVDVAVSSSDRKLELIRGKIFLAVAQLQELPLIVRAGKLVLETSEGAFGFQSVANQPVVALVTEGQLLVSQSRGLFGGRRTVTIAKDQSLTLQPDEELLASDVRPAAAAQQAQILAWREGLLSFGGELLADAVRSFDRYGPTRIMVDPALARQKVTGLFKADDPRGFAKAVAASFGGIVSIQGQVIRISAKNLVPG